MEVKRNYQVKAEDLRSRNNQLKEVVDDLESLGVLENDNLHKFKQDIQDISHFYRGDYKFSFLIQGEMNAGKSTCLNALLGQKMVAVSTVPETNFITCVVYDRKSETPLLYKTTLSKIYNSQTCNFSINNDDLVFTGISGVESIESHLNRDNKNARKKIEEFEKQLLENAQEGVDSHQLKEDFYQNAQLDDTVYVIKGRFASLEEKIQDEFILERFQLVDFPGMFEYGQNRITEIYKIFQGDTQGLMRILDHSEYASNIITKLQNYQKYPNRFLILVNKMDKIKFGEFGRNHDEKADQLIKDMQSKLCQIANEDPSNQAKQSKYLEMSQETPNILHFITGRQEMMNIYLNKYKESNSEQEKMVYDNVLKSLVNGDRIYEAYIKESNTKGTPFAEMRCLKSISNENCNLLNRLKESLADKVKSRVDELITKEYPKRVNLLRSQLIEFIERLMSEGSREKNPENVHMLNKCDGCGADPIVGVRYCCNVCNDFDFCEKCKATNEHPQHEFKKIEKFNFMEYTKDYCSKHFVIVTQTLLDFKDMFDSQLSNLFSSLIDAFQKEKDPSDFKDLFTSNCVLFSQNWEEINKRFKEEEETLLPTLQAIFEKWEEDHGPLIRLSSIGTVNLIAHAIQATKEALMLVSAASINVLKGIMLATLGQKDSIDIVRELYQSSELTALLMTDVFDSKIPIKNVKDLIAQTIIWGQRFAKISGGVAADCLQLSMRIAEKIGQTTSLGGVLERICQDEGKAKDLNEKLGKVLEKVNNIVPLPN